MIKIENLSFSYGENQVLNSINLTINKSEWVSILGHNGSGKSTLAKLLVGLLEASLGTIEIDGVSLIEDNIRQIRKKIGIVFQNPDNQFVGVTVLHDIAFGLENQNMNRKEMLERVHQYASLVGMENELAMEPQNLSGGQKQRVAIAGILAMELDYIIFDEATSMLDPKGTQDIISLINKLNKEYGKTVITITHDLDFAVLSDYVYVLNSGTLFLKGSPLEVFQNEIKLRESGLEIPFYLRFYNRIKADLVLSKNQKLVDLLWTLVLEK